MGTAALHICLQPSPGPEPRFIVDHTLTPWQEAVTEGEAVPGVCYYDSPWYKHGDSADRLMQLLSPLLAAPV